MNYQVTSFSFVKNQAPNYCIYESYAEQRVERRVESWIPH